MHLLHTADMLKQLATVHGARSIVQNERIRHCASLHQCLRVSAVIAKTGREVRHAKQGGSSSDQLCVQLWDGILAGDAETQRMLKLATVSCNQLKDAPEHKLRTLSSSPCTAALKARQDDQRLVPGKIVFWQKPKPSLTVLTL